MADEVDKTQEDIDFLISVGSKPNLKKEAEPTGYCLFCGEKIIDDPHRRWCSFECMSLWEKERKVKGK